METLPQMLSRQARELPQQPCLISEQGQLSHAELDAGIRRVAAGLQRHGVRWGDNVALLGRLDQASVVAFLGILRTGACAVPLPDFAGDEDLGRMVRDAGARALLADRALPGAPAPLPLTLGGAAPPACETTMAPRDPCNIIYSSGTTGEPKGIVHSHRMRAFQVERMGRLGLGRGATVLVATPLWSNTTLITLLPTLARGGAAVLLPRFDEQRFLELAQKHAATHTMLVPQQYRRILESPGFPGVDLSSFRAKLCTGAPLEPALKQELLRRWPGTLVEIYGQTEGGPTTLLDAARFPHKLATVGRSAEGVDLRIIDAQGRELPRGETGEVVGRAVSMMTGYHGRPELTEALTWRDDQGRPFYRTGDLGRLDADGFLELRGRLKDVIISGGLNIHPVDLEAVLLEHEAVAEAAVVGVSDPRWGERPLALAVARPGAVLDARELMAWANARLAPVHRLAGVRLVRELPRGPTGKLLRRALPHE